MSSRSFTISGPILLLFVSMVAASHAQSFTTLASFDSSNASPGGGLVQGTDGNFYGVAENGGARGRGAIFSVTPTGTISGLSNFYGANGKTPTSLVLGEDGNFYGTTYYGGEDSAGTIFRMEPQGYLTSLYSFDSPAYPSGPLIQAADGNFYGTTVNGGETLGAGDVFKITPDGTLSTIYNFCSRANCTDGKMPFGTLVQGNDGSFYGTTDGGGANQFYGTIFRVTPGGSMTVLYSFCSQSKCADGFQGNGLLQGADGNFYGITALGGSYSGGACSRNGCGTIFRITPTGSYTLLHTFCTETGCPDGNQPALLIQATDGNFYGTTGLGGSNSSCPNSNGCGTVYQLTQSGQFTLLHSFGGSDGMYAGARLLQYTNGNFYGLTGSGGAYGYGTVFSFSMGLAPFVHLVRPSGKVGQTGAILGQGLTGTTAVLINGTAASFTVVSDTLLEATVPAGATSGFVTVETPAGSLTSDDVFQVR